MRKTATSPIEQLTLTNAQSLIASTNPPAVHPGESQGASERSVPNDYQRSLDVLNLDILKTMIKMQRLSTTFRLESTEQPKMRQWRQSAYVETNSGCTFAGTIDAMRLHYANIHHPATEYSYSASSGATGKVTAVVTAKLALHVRFVLLSVKGFKSRKWLAMFLICQAMSSNWVLMLSAFLIQKRGANPRAYRRQILTLRSHLDDQIEKRQAIQQRLSEDSVELQVAVSEGKLQEALRDLFLLEYSQYHSSAISLYWFQNAAYVLDLAKNATAASGGIVSIEGNHLRHPRIAGGAALLTTVSGVLTLTIPFAGRLAGNWAATVDRHTIDQDYGQVIAQSTKDAFHELAGLEQALHHGVVVDAVSGSALDSRFYAYGQLCEIMRSHEQNIPRLLRRAKAATIENLIYGGTVGSAKVSLGVCGILAGWRYYRSPWIASRLLGRQEYCL